MTPEVLPGSILLFGATGQVGVSLKRALTEPLVALDRSQADLSQFDAVREVVRRHRPSIIVNAAAYTAVDKAESEIDRAMAINATAAGIIAQEAEELGSCLVHYSTDYVYDGRKSEPYVETDPVNPQSVYGRSKLAGDEAVRRACQRHLIFRTSWVFAAQGHNFLRTILRLASERDSLRVVDDQIGAPTSSALIAQCTRSVLREMRDKPQSDSRWGTYHLTASGAVSWHGFARYVIGTAQARGVRLKVSPSSVTPISTSEYPTSAMRPMNSRLDTSKLRGAFPDLSLPDWTVGVQSVLDELMSAGQQPQ